MRKTKFLLAMALLVFIFSGCGGSASSDSSSSTDASTLHTTISDTLTGTWAFDESYFTGKATSTAGTSILFYSVKNFRMSFADIEFDDTTIDSEASVTVFYSYTSSARYESSDVSLGDFSVKSYTNTSTTRTQEMLLSRVTDDEWILSSSSSNVPSIIITRTSSRKIEVQLTGTAYLSGINNNCHYTIIAPLVKTSTTASTEDSETTTSEDTSATGTLTGKWKLSSVTSATATSAKLGTDRILDLRLGTGINLNISSIDLQPDENTTSLTGTAVVSYDQTWTAFDDYEEMQGNEGDFTFGKTNNTMKIIKIDDSNWRIEDLANENENIVITIVSSNEISTVWNGTATTLDNENYYYEIECSFRKQ